MRNAAYRIPHRRGATTATTPARLDFMPGQMVIRLKADALGAGVATGVTARRVSTAALSSVPEAVGKPLEYLQNNMGLKAMTALFATSAPKPAAGAKIAASRSKATALASVAHSASERLAGINMMTVDPKAMTPANLKRLNQSPAVEFAEPMPARWIAARRPRAISSADPRINLQWGLRAIGWFERDWTSAATIDVAVLDTGIDQSHPDLAGAIHAYHTNGFSKTDIVGHGTHVAGVIAAIANNNAGIAGIANCRLHIWKIFPDKPFQGDFYVDGEAYLRSLREAADSGIRVLNLSIGGTERSQTEQILFDYLASRRTIVVAAMGNEFEEGNPTEYPAAYRNVIPVGAIDSDLRRASFSNTGAHISVCAPGVAILSTLPMKAAAPHRAETQYAAWDGTSMATPHVAGALALLTAAQPGLSPAAARTRLQKTCRKVPGMKKAKTTTEFGHGLVSLPTLLG